MPPLLSRQLQRHLGATRTRVAPFALDPAAALPALADLLVDPVTQIHETGAILGVAGGGARHLASDWAGRSVPEVLAPEAATRLLDAVRHSLDRRTSALVPIPYENRSYAVRLSPATPTDVLALWRDRPEVEAADTSHAAREAAETANRAKTAFLVNLSHELRTPLNAIIGYSELLLEDAADAGHYQYQADLGRVRASGRQLIDTVNAVLDVANIEAGIARVERTAVDIPALVDDLVHTLRPFADRNGNVLQVAIDGVIPSVDTDADKLRRVLANLVSNACKFTQAGSITVEIDTPTDGARRHLRVRVRDTGIGIDAPQIPRLFQDFVQLEDATTPQPYGGAGLGLSLSRRLCGLLGGRIEVTSRLGGGSTFSVYLPLTGPADAGPAAATPALSGRTS